MTKRTMEELDVAGKRALVRVDFNVPMEQGKERLEDYDHRLKATIPTIRHLLDRRCRVVLCSHLGRPRGRVVEDLRMAPVADRLSGLLGRPVRSLPDCIGPAVRAAVEGMEPGTAVMLENLRFHPGEEKNEPEFARSLASLADVFVMDAFAVAHRAHASTTGVPACLPSAAGLLMQREMEMLGRALSAPQKPLAAVMGGAKVSDKILVLENLLPNLDRLLIGGGMAVTFLKSQGHPTGASAVEEERVEFASRILQRARDDGIAVHLPEDVIVSDGFTGSPAHVRTVRAEEVPDGWYVMDIGERSSAAFAQGLDGCGTVVWNGPMGVFEFPSFKEGTRRVGEAVADLESTTIVGGGSTAEAVEELGLAERMTHVSTGGGASLEFLGGRELPGIAALPDG
ncbi:MAG: phosphoglycerate kinase [Dehalococcoidia bacterium]|nr:phosphoglycerate kinase [Dehalococcoidia bacterium]